MTSQKDAGWTSPTVFLNIVSLVMLVVGGYLATQRDDSDYVRDQAADHDRRITRLETRQETLWQDRERERDRPREGQRVGNER